ncbi:hypothetical protein AB0F93_03500 [Micromonospora tulbaghiae]|uniref:hypothetical protein n=1 Tax=Micromonospora tulbaghiae TaxID=479978 RepID=UPI003327C3FF
MQTLIVLAVLAVPAIALFIHQKIKLHGRNARLVVVDRRTMRLAEKRIPQLVASHDDRDVLRANATVHSLIVWLRGEVHTGPVRRRAGAVGAVPGAGDPAAARPGRVAAGGASPQAPRPGSVVSVSTLRVLPEVAAPAARGSPRDGPQD